MLAAQPTNQPTHQPTNQTTSLLEGVKPRAGASKRTTTLVPGKKHQKKQKRRRNADPKAEVNTPQRPTGPRRVSETQDFLPRPPGTRCPRAAAAELRAWRPSWGSRLHRWTSEPVNPGSQEADGFLGGSDFLDRTKEAKKTNKKTWQQQWFGCSFLLMDRN